MAVVNLCLLGGLDPESAHDTEFKSVTQAMEFIREFCPTAHFLWQYPSPKEPNDFDIWVWQDKDSLDRKEVYMAKITSRPK